MVNNNNTNNSNINNNNNSNLIYDVDSVEENMNRRCMTVARWSDKANFIMLYQKIPTLQCENTGSLNSCRLKSLGANKPITS